jgi:purine-nucleoside phosphorylase
VTSYFDQASAAADFVRKRIGDAPQIAVVLGSGLGAFASSPSEAVSVPYGDIPHWPVATVLGHEGRLVVGAVRRRRVAILAGRSHYYEGHDLHTVTFSTRVLGLLGIKVLILTNAAGGINTMFSRGALMLIDDHINLFGTNPLIGPNDERFGVRFPDMTEVYSRRLRALAVEAARPLDLHLEHGIYAALHGPSYETPAEIRYLRAIGADAVGMSTAPEAIVARHMGVEVLGISCITNMAAGILPAPLLHSEVMETTERVRGEFIALLEGIIERL